MSVVLCYSTRPESPTQELTLNAPIATKVVCFSRLLKCLEASMANSVDLDQTAPVLGPRCLLLYLIRQ